MIVVPAFAEGDERQPEVISALIASVIAFIAKNMRKRINRCG
jgi:hypothetical protein